MKKTKRWTSVPSDNQTIWGIEQEYGVENLGLSTDVKEKKKKRKKKLIEPRGSTKTRNNFSWKKN